MTFYTKQTRHGSQLLYTRPDEIWELLVLHDFDQLILSLMVARLTIRYVIKCANLMANLDSFMNSLYRHLSFLAISISSAHPLS